MPQPSDGDERGGRKQSRAEEEETGGLGLKGAYLSVAFPVKSGCPCDNATGKG